MIFRLQAAVARHRRRALLVALVPIGVALVGRWAGVGPDVLMPVLFVPLLAGVTLMLTFMWAPSVRRRAVVFEVDEADRCFRTPGSGAVVMAAVTTLLLIGFLTPAPGEILTGNVVRQALVVLAPILAAGQATVLWWGTGLTLRPGGLPARTRWGVLTMPWEALAGEQPRYDSGAIRLAVARPDPVRTRGWVPCRSVMVEGGNEELVAAAIRHYVTRPAERAGIGTVAGRDRLPTAGAARLRDVRRSS